MPTVSKAALKLLETLRRGMEDTKKTSNEFIEWANNKLDQIMDNEENMLYIQEQFEVTRLRGEKNAW